MAGLQIVAKDKSGVQKQGFSIGNIKQQIAVAPTVVKSVQVTPAKVAPKKKETTKKSK